MEEIRRIAFITVFRACGFASLGIFCIMIGLSYNARAAFQAGGLLTLMMVAVLVFKAFEAKTKDYRRTEMWLYIPKEHRPPKAHAQWASATVLWDTYMRFAFWTSVVSIAMWSIALFFSAMGRVG